MSTETPNDAAIKAAFANVLPKVGKVTKDGNNVRFGKYVTLDAIQEMLKPVLLEAGLSYSQHVDYQPEGACVAVTTMLWDSNGSSLNLGITRLPVPKLTPQDAGSAFTYCMRYALRALFALQSGEDDDAESIQRNATAPTRVATPTPISKPSPAPSAAKAREGTGWEEPYDGQFTLKGRTWELATMNAKQLGTVAYSSDDRGMSQYPPAIIKQCETELLKRVAAGDMEATEMVESNAPR